jgi:hypothetical protein
VPPVPHQRLHLIPFGWLKLFFEIRCLLSFAWIPRCNGSCPELAARDARSRTHVAKQEKRELKKRHKQEKSVLKRQQHAMKLVMNQHEQSRDETERFQRDPKMQKRFLRKDQKEEAHNLKKVTPS